MISLSNKSKYTYIIKKKYERYTEKRWFEHPGVNTQYLANISLYQ